MGGIVQFFRLRFCVRRITSATALAVLLATSTLAQQSAQAQTENQLYSFKNGPTDGQLPYAGVIRDSKDNLYGTTAYGGTFNHGTIFKISKHVRTLLYNFTGKIDGGFPVGLALDAAGNIYGTTQAYGSSNCGTVFKLGRTDKLTVLHAFTDSSDGCVPNSLIRDHNGNLYSTTVFGGGPANAGTVFKVDPTGKETILYSFTGGVSGSTDGASPVAGVIRDIAGNLYGTTSYGGAFTWGTVFKVDPAGNETILHSFAYGAQGADPQSSLVRDAAGNLYGNTGLSGAYDEGVVFKFDPATGTETVLHNFGNGHDGKAPIGTLTLDSAGHIYGATQQGGRAGAGTVFVIVP